MTESDHLDSDPQLDARLAAWGRSLRPGEERLQSIKAAVLKEFESDRPPLLPTRATLRTKARPRQRGWILIPVVLCLGIAGWGLLRPDAVKPGSKASIAFSSDDVRYREDLVCELERVFEHQLAGIRQRGATLSVDTVSVDAASEPGDGQALGLVLRFVLQDRIAGRWTTIDQEEVIGPADDQFRFAAPSQLEIECWLHLLPDQSLWLESMVAPFEGEEVRLAAQFQINHPQVLWSTSSGPLERRVLVVYELLNPCSGGVI